jgi:hypothetical protein
MSVPGTPYTAGGRLFACRQRSGSPLKKSSGATSSRRDMLSSGKRNDAIGSRRSWQARQSGRVVTAFSTASASLLSTFRVTSTGVSRKL